MSLAFLSKKSWHTANLRQKHAAEEKKVAELRKNIEEERQLQELRQLQAAQGNKSAAVERLDWMYEGPSAAQEKSAEEYLLGKEYRGEDEKAAKGDVDLSTTTKYGSLALTKSTLPANDAFQRLNEDPMMLIRKRQQAAREEVLKNPVKMKRIKDQVERLKDDKKARKKAKKAAKKEKKHARKEEKRRLKNKRKHSEDDSEESDASRYEDEGKAGNRLKDYPSKHHRGHGHGRDRERGRSPSRSVDNFGRDRRLASDSEERRSRTPPRQEQKRDMGRRRADYDGRRRSPSPADRRDRHRSRSPLNYQNSHRSRTSGRHDKQHEDSPLRRDANHQRSGRRRNPSRERDPVDVRDDDRREKDPGSTRKVLHADGRYGLISQAGAVECKDVDKTSLGPNAKYLAKAREAKRLEEEERRRKLGKVPCRESRALTDEEKKRIAQQMADDAKQRDEYIAKRANRKKDELDLREQEASSNPEFLR
ncbi:unnamed protein product [Phytophthora fragariaefolia]|uniref:Unnamed protein product n=1 Tax=Phytophthora fragariaefolia TaxID=1490495 RepID=A0A9W6YEH9_9STRA|nr:unnamed protein product [Phytophthora fragariaefolia]